MIMHCEDKTCFCRFHSQDGTRFLAVFSELVSETDLEILQKYFSLQCSLLDQRLLLEDLMQGNVRRLSCCIWYFTEGIAVFVRDWINTVMQCSRSALTLLTILVADGNDQLNDDLNDYKYCSGIFARLQSYECNVHYYSQICPRKIVEHALFDFI